jgi:signal transduction histidine kinase
MRWPLRNQILVPFVLLLLGVICTVSALNAWLATQRTKNKIEEQLQGIAATLADSSFPLTDMVLRQMHGLSGAEFVLTDANGRALATSGLALPIEGTSLAVEDSQQLRLGPPVTVGEQRFFEMVLAIRGRGLQPAGRLHILYPEKFWLGARSEAALPPLVVGVAALLATAVLAIWIAARLTRPIVELRTQVNRISEADYSPMPLPERNDELRDLAGAVNRMAGQLAEMEKAIRRSERLALLGQLAGGLAHHLRNNVTGALMAVQLHARECDADPESLNVALRQLALTEENLKQFLAAPQKSAHGLNSCTLTPALSQGERGQKGLAMHWTECRISDVIHEVVELLDPSLRHRRVQLSVVEKGATGEGFRADGGQLRQLLMNLVLNAADAAGPGGWVRIEAEEGGRRKGEGRSGCRMEGGGRRAEGGSEWGVQEAEARGQGSQRNVEWGIEGGRRRAEDGELHPHPGPHPEGDNRTEGGNESEQELILRVVDNGAGPPREILERLFEPFATSKSEGVGLGLTVAQQIAESHSGRIVFQRNGGETCFEVHIPVVQTSPSSAPIEVQGLQPLDLAASASQLPDR